MLKSTETPLLRQTVHRGWMLCPVLFALAGFAALSCDLPIARWFHGGHCPGDLMRLLGLFEAYAHGYGVFAILLTVFVLDQRRYLFPRVLTIVASAGLAANLLKLLIARTRPRAFLLDGKVWETFGHWFPWGHMTSAQESFPSGHTAAAVGLTTALWWLYPRGRWLFVLFAALAGCQRMASDSHFLSDVLWGAAIGSVPAVLFLPRGLLSPLFDRLESYLGARRRWNAVAESPAPRIQVERKSA